MNNVMNNRFLMANDEGENSTSLMPAEDNQGGFLAQMENSTDPEPEEKKQIYIN